MKGNQKYWNGIEELEGGDAFEKALKDEFAEDLPLEEQLTETNLELTSNRRDFLKLFVYSYIAHLCVLNLCTNRY